MNVNCMEVGGLSLKEPSQPQSRLSQWTHSNSMDSLSGNPSNLENNLNKHGMLLGKKIIINCTEDMHMSQLELYFL